MSTKDLRKAYHPNYFSVDSILAAQTLVPCMTQTSIPKFGFLAPGCNSEDLPFGTNLQLPIWAARVLCRPLRTFVGVTIPPGFKEAHGKVTEEDPNIVDLNKINDNFYEAGHLCTALFHSEAGELAEMLPDVLQARVLCLGSATGTTIPNGTPIKAELMDNVEKKLLEDTQKSRTNVDEWLEVFKVPPEVEAQLRRPKPPPVPAPVQVPVQRPPAQNHHQNQPQQHLQHHQQHQNYPHRQVAHHNPPSQPQRTITTHSQSQAPGIHSSYGNPYAHLQSGGLPPPYNNINVASHNLGSGGSQMTHNINTQQHQGHAHQHPGLPHGHYPHHHGHNM